MFIRGEHPTAREGNSLTIRVLYTPEKGAPVEHASTKSFRIGRAGCELTVRSPLVSRHHADVTFEDGAWWLVDRSKNGIFDADEARVRRLRLADRMQLRLGKTGPTLQFFLDAPAPSHRPTPPVSTRPEPPASARRERPGRFHPAHIDVTDHRFNESVFNRIREVLRNPGPTGLTGRLNAVARKVQYEVKGEFQGKLRRRNGVVLVLVLLVGALGYGLWRQYQERTAYDYFTQMRRQNLELAREIVASDGEVPDLEGRLRRSRIDAFRYDEYVDRWGFRKKASPEDALIYKTAYIFGEVEFQMPEGFKEEVYEGIRYWQQHRGEYVRALRRADENGYTRHIVATLQKYGLPPQFFYLALQESRFVPSAVGPSTNYGYAKGMWQFIPRTAERYGLNVGTTWMYNGFAQDDERFQVDKATDAAARYLLYIYSDLAQASGLLVMAGYNWGEHRIRGRLDDLAPVLPEDSFRGALAGVPETLKARTYWNFYTRYGSRIPYETRDYVKKIFAAAVIGENPALFGFDLSNPLEPYLNLDPLTEETALGDAPGSNQHLHE